MSDNPATASFGRTAPSRFARPPTALDGQHRRPAGALPARAPARVSREFRKRFSRLNPSPPAVRTLRTAPSEART